MRNERNSHEGLPPARELPRLQTTLCLCVKQADAGTTLKFNIWIVLSLAVLPAVLLIAGMAVSDALPRTSLLVLGALGLGVIAIVAGARHSLDVASRGSSGRHRQH